MNVYVRKGKLDSMGAPPKKINLLNFQISNSLMICIINSHIVISLQNTVCDLNESYILKSVTLTLRSLAFTMVLMLWFFDPTRVCIATLVPSFPALICGGVVSTGKSSIFRARGTGSSLFSTLLQALS